MYAQVYCKYNTHPVVTITTPPENTTVCRGSDVIISCGYQSAIALPVTWIINETSFDQEEVVNSPLYQLNNPTSPQTFSLTVFSINGTTTFQCVVLSTPNTTSTRGTVTVISGMYTYVCTVTPSICTDLVGIITIMRIDECHIKGEFIYQDLYLIFLIYCKHQYWYYIHRIVTWSLQCCSTAVYVCVVVLSVIMIIIYNH